MKCNRNVLTQAKYCPSSPWDEPSVGPCHVAAVVEGSILDRRGVQPKFCDASKLVESSSASYGLILYTRLAWLLHNVEVATSYYVA